MRSGCFPWLIAIALMIGGGQSLYTGITNRNPAVFEISKFNSAAESAKWLKITGGELDVLNYAYTSVLGTAPTEVYVPLVSPGVDSSKTPIHILHKTKDPEILDTVHALIDLEEAVGNDSAKLIVEIGKIGAEKLRPQRDIEGLVQYGIDSGSKDEKVRKLYDNLVEESVVLKEGGKPSILMGMGLLIGGLAIAGYMARGLVSKEVSGPPVPPQA